MHDNILAMADYETQALFDEADKLHTGLMATEELISRINTLENPKDSQGAIEASMGAILIYLDVSKEEIDLMDGDDLSMESIRDLPMKIYQGIAKALMWIAAKFRSLWRALTDRGEKRSKQVEKKLSTFKANVERSEATIARFKLSPGDKLTKEEKEEIKAADAFVFTDASGRILSKEMFEDNMTLLIPAGLRFDNETMAPLVMGKKYDGLIANIKTSLKTIDEITSGKVRTEYETLIDKAMTFTKKEDFEKLLDVNWAAVTDEDANYMKRFSLRKSGTVYSGKPLIGNIYPLFQRTSVGSLKLTRFAISSKNNLVSKEFDTNVPKTLPKLTLRDIEELQDIANTIRSKREHLAGEIETVNKHVEKFSSGNGKLLKERALSLDEFFNGRNKEDVEKVKGVIRGIAKSHNIAYSYLRDSHTYLYRLETAIDVLLIKILGQD